MNGTKQAEGSLKNFYGYRETFAKATTWVDVPKELTFVHTNNPYDEEDNARYADEGDTSLFAVAGEDAERVAAARNDEDYEMARQLAQAAYPAYATQGLEALSAVASRDQYSYAPPPAPMGQHDQQQSGPSPSVTQPSTSRNLDFILNPTSGSSNIDPRLHSVPSDNASTAANERREQNTEHVRTASYGSSHGRPSLLGAKGPSQLRTDRRPAIESPGIAFLLRDYSERCGLWMDLNDHNLYFATVVPVLAVKSPLLLYSCVALSAKSLARTGGRRPVMGGQTETARQSKMESWPGLPIEDFNTKAREYYDLAISLLREALSGAVRPQTAALPEHASPSSISFAQGQPLPSTDSDGLVAATCILCVYEFLDASTPEWSRHLDGAKSLFEIANDRVVHLSLPPSPLVARTPASQLSSSAEPLRSLLGPGRRAVFWCFARQDMLSAFINVTHTRLDTFDLDLWRSAGLKITSEGYVCPSNASHPDYHPDNAMADDMASNALVWLLAKLVNFIAAGDGVPDELSPLGLGLRQDQLLEYWEKLDAQLLAWHDGVPDSFHPTAMRTANNDMGMEEVWFPRPMCASSAQWWHFARIQLLHNKPHLTTATPSRGPAGLGIPVAGTSLAARHASYNTILTKSREHAKQIVAVGLGRSDEGARVNTVQPLWTAGLVLGGSAHEHVSEQTWMWRRSVVSLLRGTERDMGWASEYRVQSLLELWGLPAKWNESIPT